MKHLLVLPLFVLLFFCGQISAQTQDSFKTILSFSPLQFSENGIGVGFGYERFLTSNHKVSFYLPAYVTWNYIDNSTYFPSTPVQRATNTRFEIGPGIKLNLFPVRHIRSADVTYAIGPNLMFGFGNETNFDFSGNSTKISRTLLGVMINQSLNVDVTPKVYAGIELGLGYTYINFENGNTALQAGLVQFSMKIGYKY